MEIRGKNYAYRLLYKEYKYSLNHSEIHIISPESRFFAILINLNQLKKSNSLTKPGFKKSTARKNGSS